MSVSRFTMQQRRFCEAYVFETNGLGWKAAHLAGYSNTNPTIEPTKKIKAYLSSEASRQKGRPHVLEYIEQLQTQERERQERERQARKLEIQKQASVATRSFHEWHGRPLGLRDFLALEDPDRRAERRRLRAEYQRRAEERLQAQLSNKLSRVGPNATSLIFSIQGN